MEEHSMAKAAEPTALLAVREPFAAENGEVFRLDELVEADHWAVKKWPHFFGPPRLKHPVKRAAEPRIEQATAAPGEKRGA
jgi:hypothetical protein